MNRPKAIFILGGTGDLAKKKLLPALAKIRKNRDDLKVVYSLARSKSEEWETIACNLDPDFRIFCNFIPFDVSKWEDYLRLGQVLEGLSGYELIFYLSLSPFLYEQAILNLGRLLRNFSNPRKLVVEKPFGFDLSSAQKLNNLLYRYFIEEEIYRIDHFLGKDTVQNIFSLRFSNTIFEGVWNKNFIDHVQIVAIEDVGVENRIDFYDKVGAVRDMLQNHLLQMLAFTAMEPPCLMTPQFIRDEKVKVLRSLDISEFVKGQYEGYPKEGSRTETFVAVKAYIENLRWQGVPFYLMTGKKLGKKLTQITVVFKEIPKSFVSLLDCAPKQNRITFQVAPKNSLSIAFELRPPTGKFIACPIETVMEYNIEESIGQPLPEAYETLLEDILDSDQSLFIRADEIEVMWEKVEPLLSEQELEVYKEATIPNGAIKLMEKDRRNWIL
ncbi:glucose-6-phosphate dehydrogenase [Thermocrinis jamiesonii]|uniref:glucose-6-phosphate dehydrogenase n=1 Tax=Thermocrinis jamiesonii TaxID=1302351 RepID=UPI000496242F|nr:glucose-6-phosphate dehydrogenase [Thermocrinis jamiesonii]